MPHELSFGTNSGASAWKQMEKWRAKRKEEREAFENASALLIGSFTSAAANKIEQQGILAAELALKRLQAATAAKQAKNNAAFNPDNPPVTGFTVQESIAQRYSQISAGVDVTV